MSDQAAGMEIASDNIAVDYADAGDSQIEQSTERTEHEMLMWNLLLPLCLRCSKHADKMLNCDNPVLQKCEYCTEMGHECSEIPLAFVRTVNQLQRVAQRVYGGTATATITERFLLSHARYVVSVEAHVRLNPTRPRTSGAATIMIAMEMRRANDLREELVNATRLAAGLPVLIGRTNFQYVATEVLSNNHVRRLLAKDPEPTPLITIRKTPKKKKVAVAASEPATPSGRRGARQPAVVLDEEDEEVLGEADYQPEGEPEAEEVEEDADYALSEGAEDERREELEAEVDELAGDADDLLDIVGPSRTAKGKGKARAVAPESPASQLVAATPRPAVRTRAAAAAPSPRFNMEAGLKKRNEAFRDNQRMPAPAIPRRAGAPLTLGGFGPSPAPRARAPSVTESVRSTRDVAAINAQALEINRLKAQLAKQKVPAAAPLAPKAVEPATPPLKRTRARSGATAPASTPANPPATPKASARKAPAKAAVTPARGGRKKK